MDSPLTLRAFFFSIEISVKAAFEVSMADLARWAAIRGGRVGRGGY